LRISRTGYLNYINLSFPIESSDVDFGVITLRPGDLNRNGQVTSSDLLILFANYSGRGYPITNPLADINGDGVVDYNDLQLLLNNFMLTADVDG